VGKSLGECVPSGLLPTSISGVVSTWTWYTLRHLVPRHHYHLTESTTEETKDFYRSWCPRGKLFTILSQGIITTAPRVNPRKLRISVVFVHLRNVVSKWYIVSLGIIITAQRANSKRQRTSVVFGNHLRRGVHVVHTAPSCPLAASVPLLLLSSLVLVIGMVCTVHVVHTDPACPLASLPPHSLSSLVYVNDNKCALFTCRHVLRRCH